ncbi:MAG: SNF2-related protein, partial [bacterium]
MELPTRLYRIKKGWAQHQNLPVIIAGVELGETSKAVYLYGHGAMSAQTIFNACCICGTELRHPGSILLGIGPVCLGNWGLRDEMIKGKTPEEVDRIIGKVIRDRKVDCWIPKSCITDTTETDEKVKVPKEHPRLGRVQKRAEETVMQASRIKFEDGSPGVKIVFNFPRGDSRFMEMVTKVKTLSGRRFVTDKNGNKFWTVPLLLENVDNLKGWGYQLSERLKEFLEEKMVTVDDVERLGVPKLKKTLYPFQEKGVAFIEAKGGRAIIGDEMGLGKTVQALAWLQLHPELRPAIVVPPSSAKYNWAMEAEDWLSKVNAQVISGTELEPIYGDVIIINYDILRDWLERLIQIQPKVLIIDEIHYIKNHTAIRTKAVQGLAH